jgi:asparagine synthetase B (glutamine-hydrolysing)
MLPPLANIFAFSSQRRDLISEVAADLASTGTFAEVWRPHERWVVAEAPLPHSPHPSPAVRLGGLVFVEGRDRVLRPGHEADDVVRLHELLDKTPAALSQLLGDFGFVSFRPDGSAVTVRSCGGRVPLYVWADDESVAIATLQRDLAAFLPGELDIDPLGHATWTAQPGGFTPEDRTLVAGARLLPAGCYITSSAGSSSPFVRYWDPRPTECHRLSSVGIDEVAGDLRALLVAHLGGELHPDGGNFLSLSGGVDSSSLAALAVRAASRPISATLSVLPPDDPSRAWELGYIEPLLEEIGGVAERYLQNGDSDAIDRLYRATAPSLVPTVHPVLCRLPQLATEIDIKTYVGGEYCDDLFGALLLHDWNEVATPWLAATRTGDDPHGRASVLRWARDRALALIGNPVVPLPSRLPEFVLPGLDAEYQRWRQHRRRLLGADHLPWRHTWARRDRGLGWIEMNWEIVSPLGVRRVLPFVTREIIELAMSCHPADVLADGPKTLLRRGLAADVPQRNLSRPDKGGWGRGLARSQVDMPRSLADGAWKVVDERWIESAATTAAPVVAWAIRHLIRSCMEFRRLRAERVVRTGMHGAEAAHEGT